MRARRAGKRPHVVCLGGGHGLATTLLAVRRYAGEITAVVSVADDGGSSGRLREDLGIAAPGDLRKCLGALLPGPSALGAALEYRFASGELAGHAFGNVLIAALAGSMGDFVGGVEEAGRLLQTVGRVLPASEGPVALFAETARTTLTGQVRIMAAEGVRQISLIPPDPAPPAAVLEALAAADQVVIGPGSLYTSVLAACAVPAISAALAASPARRVYVCNLREQIPETKDYDVARHVEALLAHGVVPDMVLADTTALKLGEIPAGVGVVEGPLAAPNGLVHDPARLEAALSRLLG